jgi:hypothetical protein
MEHCRLGALIPDHSQKDPLFLFSLIPFLQWILKQTLENNVRRMLLILRNPEAWSESRNRYEPVLLETYTYEPTLKFFTALHPIFTNTSTSDMIWLPPVIWRSYHNHMNNELIQRCQTPSDKCTSRPAYTNL